MLTSQRWFIVYSYSIGRNGG